MLVHEETSAAKLAEKREFEFLILLVLRPRGPLLGTGPGLPSFLRVVAGRQNSWRKARLGVLNSSPLMSSSQGYKEAS